MSVILCNYFTTVQFLVFIQFNIFNLMFKHTIYFKTMLQMSIASHKMNTHHRNSTRSHFTFIDNFEKKSNLRPKPQFLKKPSSISLHHLNVLKLHEEYKRSNFNFPRFTNFRTLINASEHNNPEKIANHKKIGSCNVTHSFITSYLS